MPRRTAMHWKSLTVVATCLVCASCATSGGIQGEDDSLDGSVILNGNNNNNSNVSTPYCGDGEVQSGEECDDGSLNSDSAPNACRTNCTQPVCGDGVADDLHGEVCDDGGQVDDDGCSADCKAHREIVGLGIDAFAYDIARDNNDHLHIIWKPQDAVFQPFHYGRIVNGQIVDEVVVDGTTGALRRGYRPRLAVSPNGTLIHFSWANTGRSQILHAYRVDGQWSHESIYAAPGGCVADEDECVTQPVSGIDDQGVVHIIALTYTRPSPLNTRIRYWRKQLGGGWLDQATTLFGPYDESDWRSTAMFTDRDGGIHAAWKRHPSPGRYVYTASGGQLQTSDIIEIPPPPGRNHVGMGDLYVTDGGDVHTAYRGDATGGASIWHTVKPSGQAQFSTPCGEVGPVLEHEGCPEHNPWPAIGVDQSGRILVAWSENPESTGPIVSDVFLSIHDAGAWTYEHHDSDANQHPYSKVAIAVTHGSTYMYWRTSESTPELMQARFTYAK